MECNPQNKYCNLRFITDINELCDNCALRERVGKILKAAISDYELNSKQKHKSGLRLFIEKEMIEAHNEINEISKHERIAVEHSLDINNITKRNRIVGILSWQAYLDFCSEKLDETNTITDNLISEPNNTAPDIFVSGWSFKLFEDLRSELSVSSQPYAKYGFIFNTMKEEKRSSLLKNITATRFIKYLDGNYNTSIAKKYEGFKRTGSKEDKKAYSRLFNLYSANITHHLKKGR